MPALRDHPPHLTGGIHSPPACDIAPVYRHAYVHVPFCARRCSYCDFSIAVRRVVPVEEYLGALRAEIDVRGAHEDRNSTVETLYFGGGTPSRLGGDGIARAIDLVQARWPLVAGGELTIEANPEDVTPDAARRWRAAGVNRVSLGSQSFDDRVLQWMHRTHDAEAVPRAMGALREAGITDISLDLIFALPEALGRDFERDVSRVLELEPDHVSLYGLTVESHTPLGKWVGAGLTIEQPEEGYESDFLAAHRLLTASGFEHYEVSNYARPGRRARHNSAYWSGAPYAGLGPSAHGFDGDVRRWNRRAYADWVDALARGADPVEGQETLTPANRVAEAVYLGLRTSDGLPLTPGDASERDMADSWVREGWATLDAGGRIRCTPLGWLRLDALAAALTHHRSR